MSRFRPKPRKILGATVAATGMGALGDRMNKAGPYGKVGSAALGLAPFVYGEHVVAGDQKFNWNDAHRNVSAYSAYEDAKYDKKHQAYQQQVDASNAEQASIDDAIAQLHAAYGISDPSGKYGAIAGQNAQGLEGEYARYTQDFLGAGTRKATNTFDTNERNARFWAAERGQSGGTLDANNHLANLQGLLGDQSQVSADAAGAVDNLRSSDQATRLQLEHDVAGGGSQDEAILNALRAHSSSIRSARDAIPGEAIGQLASYGGDTARENASARGYYAGQQQNRRPSLFTGGRSADSTTTV